MLVRVRGTFAGVVTGNGTVEYPISYRDGARIAGGAFRFKIVNGQIKAEDGQADLLVLGAGEGQANPPSLKLIAVPLLPGKPFVIEFRPVPNAPAQGSDVVDVSLPPADVAVVLSQAETESLVAAKAAVLKALGDVNAALSGLSGMQDATDAALQAAALLNITPVADEAARINFFNTTNGNVSCRQLDTLHIWSRYNGVIEDVGPWSLATLNFMKETGRLVSSAPLLRPVEFTAVPRLPRRPVIPIICDDAYIQDFTDIKAMLDEFGAKASFALTVNFLNSGGNFMTTAQALQLQAEGHSMLGHSLNHKDETTYGADVAGLYADLLTTRTTLQGMGFVINHHVYPYTNNNHQVREAVRATGYRSAIGIGAEVQVPPLRQYAVKRMQVTAQTTQAQLYAWADQVLAKNGMGPMLIHSGYDFPPVVRGYFRNFIQYAQGLGIEFMSYDKAFEIFGNQVEIGDYTGGAGTVVDRDGVFWSDQAGAYLRFPLNTFNGMMGRTSFPDNKVSECAFSAVSNAGLPCSSGSLITDRTIGGDTYGYNKWNRQTVYAYETDDIWQRRALTDITWTDWVLISNAYPAAIHAGYNPFTGLSPITAFKLGSTTTYPFNDGGNGTDKGYPPGYYAGTVTTVRTYAGAAWDSQTVKKYNSTETQMRTTDEAGNWGVWVKIIN